VTAGEPEPLPPRAADGPAQIAAAGVYDRLEPIPTLEQIRTGDDTPATPEGVR